MVAAWGVTRLGLWWAVTASWRGSRVCSRTPWPGADAWCCAPARPGSGRPGWPRSWPQRLRPAGWRWRGRGRPTGAARRRTACGGWCWLRPQPVPALPLTCGRRCSAPPNWAPSPASRSGSRCSPRSAGGWRRRPRMAVSCWCSMTCSGRTRRRRCCWSRSSASSAGRASWSSRPIGTGQTGSCRGCRRRLTPSEWTCTACPPRRSGIYCSPLGWRRRRTGRNPFLVRELAGAPASSVPGRVLEATAYRLSQLSEQARDVLQAAAVAGNSFSAGVVAKMLDRSVLSLLGPLSECAAAGFLVAGDRPGDQRFSHALVSSAVVARLSAEEQRRLHTAAADAIEALYEGQVRLHLAEVARHRVEASLPGDRARAVAACEAAACVAWDALAFEEAVRLYRQALAAGQGELGEADRDRLELALAAALHRSGDLPGAQETAARAGRRAERRRDRLGLARAALVMEATGVPEWDGEICRVCEQALAGNDLPDDVRARVSASYAQALVYRGEYDKAGSVSRDALAAAESAADPVALVDALRARQLACCAPEGLAERIVLAGRMLEAAEVLGSAWAEMWGRMWRIDTLFETGQLRLIQRELTDLSSCLDRLSGPVGRWQYLEVAATLALATGRFAEAERLAREAFKVFSDMGHPAAIGG